MKRNIKAELWRDLCAQLGEDDGVDSRHENRHRDNSRDEKHDQRLCGRVARVVQLSLAADVHDPEVASLIVKHVTTAPDASKLRVTLSPSPLNELTDPQSLLPRIERVRGVLRTEIARAINRRRTPNLLFVIEPLEEFGDA